MPSEDEVVTHLLLQDRFPQDMEGAVAAVRSRGDSATADLWQEALDNLTMGTPGDFPLSTLTPFQWSCGTVPYTTTGHAVAIASMQGILPCTLSASTLRHMQARACLVSNG